MDVFTLTCSGWVGKVYGWRTDKWNREYFKFSMATHRQKGNTQETLWLNCACPDPIANIIAERSVQPGEQVLITTDFAELAAVVMGTEARAFLNVTCRQLVFLSHPAKPAQLEREPDLLERVVDYNLLLALRTERTDRIDQSVRVG